MYMLNGLTVNTFLKAQKMTTIQSRKHSDNEYVEEKDEVTDEEGSEDGDSDDDDDDDIDDQD